MLGSSRVITTNTGVVCYDADFYPYGGESAITNNCPAANKYKFEGKERDDESGNDDFGARYYSWRFGRWLSADWSAVPAPVPYANFTNPQTLNLYAMVHDDPETFADLDGHDDWIFGVLYGIRGSQDGTLQSTLNALEESAQKPAQNATQATQPAQNKYDPKKSGPEDPTNPGHPLSENSVVKKASDEAWMKTTNGTARSGLAEAGFSIEYKDGKISIANKTDSVNSDKKANGLSITTDANTIAILHTHGNKALPTPSPGDRNPNAQVPDFVRSQRSLYVTVPIRLPEIHR